MKKFFLTLTFVLLLNITSLFAGSSIFIGQVSSGGSGDVAGSKQYFIPGYGMVDDKNTGKTYFIPGYGIINESVSSATPTSIRGMLILTYLISDQKQYQRIYAKNIDRR
jgi:hypothetical protein